MVRYSMRAVQRMFFCCPLASLADSPRISVGRFKPDTTPRRYGARSFIDPWLMRWKSLYGSCDARVSERGLLVPLTAEVARGISRHHARPRLRSLPPTCRFRFFSKNQKNPLLAERV